MMRAPRAMPPTRKPPADRGPRRFVIAVTVLTSLDQEALTEIGSARRSLARWSGWRR